MQRNDNKKNNLGKQNSLFNLKKTFEFFKKHDPVEKCDMAGGFTNQTSLVKTHSERFYVVRKPGRSTSQYINRKDESYNTRIAYDLGVTAEVVADHQDGNKVTRYLKNPQPMNKMLVKHPENLRQVVETMRTLHRSEKLFANQSDMFERCHEMLAVLRKLDKVVARVYEESAVWQELQKIEAAIKATNPPKAPCHNDDTPGNYILSEGKMYMIDFEYSGNNDPVCDLAYLAMECELAAVEENFLLNLYFDGKPEAAEVSRFYLYQPVIEFYTALWARAQLVNHNVKDIPDMEKMERKRFNHAKELLESQDLRMAYHCLTGTMLDGGQPEPGANHERENDHESSGCFRAIKQCLGRR